MTAPGALVLRTLADTRRAPPHVLSGVRADSRCWDVALKATRRRLRCQQCGRRPERLLVGYHQAAALDG